MSGNNTLLRKKLCLEVPDEQVEYQFRALKIISELKNMGFQNHNAASAVVMHFVKDVDRGEFAKAFVRFWNLRNFSPELIYKLEGVIEKLKNE